MTNTIEITTNSLNNNTLFDVLDECTKHNIDTKTVETIKIKVGNKVFTKEFSWKLEDGEFKISGLQMKW